MARGSFKSNNRKQVENTKKRKKFSVHSVNKSNKTNFKRSYVKNEKNNVTEKRQKIQAQHMQISSSDSEEETKDILNQLLSTFNSKSKENNVIDTDSESEENIDVSDDEKNEIYENIPIEEISEESDSDEKNTSNSECLEDTEESEHEDLHLRKGEIDKETQIEDYSCTDSFVQHLCYDLSDDLVDTLQSKHKKFVQNIEWPWMGKLQVSIPICKEVSKEKSDYTITENKIYAPLGKVPSIMSKNVNFDELHLKSQIHNYIKSANKELGENVEGPFSEFQLEMFALINNYQDLYFCDRTFKNGEEIRFVYCLHTINHVLKTRIKVLHHNARLSKKGDTPGEYRDQGLVRPKVLIIVPFRDSCLKIVQNLINLLVPTEAGQVINKNRFMDEFTGSEIFMPKKNPKPEDYELNFAGNCDDNFKIGIQVTKKSLKLYADFYSSDIIITSPLGLRLTVGAEGEAERDFDFLASIELLILDQSELFIMQNWDHLIHILDHLHIQPKHSHGTDFSRIRTWTLNGLSRYYRQTLIFCSFALPEINAIFNRRCLNYSGAIRTVNPIQVGSIVNVHVQIPQVFRRFEADGVVKAIESRFEFFVNKVLPQYRDTIMKHTLIYVPSYFDYVKIRNYFKREDIGFVQICEYTKDPKIARARDYFFHGEKHFLLYSERFHYFRRIRVKGIRHIVFYQPPIFPYFYSELCNFMLEANMNKKSGSASNMTVTVIYSKYDSHQIASILGTERLAKMAASSNNFHMFTSSEN